MRTLDDPLTNEPESVCKRFRTARRGIHEGFTRISPSFRTRDYFAKTHVHG